MIFWLGLDETPGRPAGRADSDPTGRLAHQCSGPARPLRWVSEGDASGIMLLLGPASRTGIGSLSLPLAVVLGARGHTSPLFDRDALGEVARLVDVAAAHDRDVVRQQLERDHLRARARKHLATSDRDSPKI